mgnify:CR=1 FL=1
MPRFNLSWLYMFIAMTIAYLYFTSDDSAGIDRQLTYTEFKDMVNKGYANKIIAYNDNTVDMFIKPEYVKDVFKTDCSTNEYKNYINILIVYFRTLPEEKNKRRFADNFPADYGRYRKKIDAYSDKSARTFP